MKYLLPLFIFAVSCSDTRMMRQKEFNCVYIGEHEKELFEMAGAPSEVKELQAGLKEITYVERIRIGNAREIFRQYIFILSPDGRVVNKRVEDIASSAVQIQF